MGASPIIIRYYQDQDGAQVRRLFKESLCIGGDSALHHLCLSELKAPHSIFLSATVVLGAAMGATARAPMLSAALVFIGALTLLTRWFSAYSAFMAFVNGSITGPDMMDVRASYGLVESADPAQSPGTLVPSGKNAFWVAEAPVPGDESRMEVVGCIGIDISTSPGDETAELRRFAVAARCRGQGLGRRLVNTLMEHARATGVQSVWLRTQSANAVALLAYEKYGFTVDGEYVPFKNMRTHVLSRNVD